MTRPVVFVDWLFARNRWVIHLLFWLFIVVFYALFFGRKSSNYLQTLFFVGLLMPVTIGASYFINYYLVPRYLMKERYWFFVVYFIYTMVISLFLEMMIAMLTFIVMAEVRIKNMSPASIDLFFLLAALLMVVFLSVAIKMVLHWKSSEKDYQTLMKEKVETELRFLKAQLNPHFLFNTLNNLYYLSTEKSDKAPKAILQLSEILDYTMHSGKWVFVPLANEVKQVQNYIALESLRYEDRLSVITRFNGNLELVNICPMMMLTLIENAFKHGVMPSSGNAWIELSVEVRLNQIFISVRNSSSKANQGSGIGLNNLRSQLDHVYGPDYSMEIVHSNNVFSVSCVLNCS